MRLVGFGSALGAAVVAGIVIGCGGGGGSVDTTTASATDGTSPTSSGSAGTSAGALPANQVIYSEYTPSTGGSYNVEAITPDGVTNTILLAGIPAALSPVAFNPNVKSSYVFGGSAGSGKLYGIYSGTGISLTGAKTLVAPSYSAMLSLVMSQDGTVVVYTATNSAGTADNVYEVAAGGGTPTTIDSGESVAISPNNVVIAYSQYVGTYLQIFLYNLSTGARQQLTTDPTDHDFPQFSKDGTLLIYGKLAPGGAYNNLAVWNFAQSVEVDPANPGQLNEVGASFNTGSTSLSFADPGVGIYTETILGGIAPTQVKASASITVGETYWTGTNGRGIGGAGWVAAARAPSRVRR